jgi:hypothetical protein
VRLSLERRREGRHQDPPLAVALPDDARVNRLVVRPHPLDDYDRLHTQTHTGDEEDDDDKNR